MARVPPSRLIAGRNPVISGHEPKNLQTAPLRPLLILFRIRRGMIFRGVRVFFPLRFGSGKPVKTLRAPGDIFRRPERRSFLSVPLDGNVPVLDFPIPLQEPWLHRRARCVFFSSRRRLSGLCAHARVRDRTVFSRVGIPRRRSRIEGRRSVASRLLGRKNVPGARRVRVAEKEIR